MIVINSCSYEKIHGFYQRIDEKSDLSETFKKMLTALFQDVAKMQESITELESSITR